MVSDFLQKLALHPEGFDQYTLRDGLIRYKGRLWLPTNMDFTKEIVEAFHVSPLGGHSGLPVTLSRLKNLFYWKGLKQQVRQYVQECPICQQAKPERSRYPGLLAPLPVPTQFCRWCPWISWKGCPVLAILIVSWLWLTSYAHFIGLAHPFTGAIVATAFMDSIHKLHIMPRVDCV